MEQLTRLKEGKAISAFDGFVESWNFICTWIENIIGEGEEDKSKSLTIDRTVPDHPVIRGSGGGGDGQIKSIQFESGPDSNLEFDVTDDGEGNLTVKIDAYYV